jgi:hypothetical protein
MRTDRQTINAVIVRRKREARLPEQDQAIQYAAAIVFFTIAGVYRMPACAGMTRE